MPLLISSVGKRSIFQKYGISKGDSIVSINGREVHDFFGVMHEMEFDSMLFVIEKKNSEQIRIKIARKNYKSIETEFEEHGMLHCHNKCIFCFIDQNPENMRKELYFKDDDYRESLTCGNFITLSNLSEKMLDNIAEHNLSPLYISLHSSEDYLREKIFGRPNPVDKIRYLIKKGVRMHFQIVLMRGINDKKHLLKTLEFAKKNKAISLGIVPVGLTKHRKNLYQFKMFGRIYSKNLIESVEKWKEDNSFKKIFLADEFYMTAGISVPAKTYYKGFPQLENGIGMVSLFEDSVKRIRNRKLKEGYAILCGRSFGEYLLRTKCFNAERIYPVANGLFGENVTVTGLLSGKDILLCLKNIAESDIILYRTVFNTDKLTLDNYTKENIEKLSGKRINLINEFEEIQEYLE
jgi:putative radical SAM enzyme (TIGR03279 family)